MVEGAGWAAAQMHWKTPGSAGFVAIPMASLSSSQGDVFDGGAGNDTLMGGSSNDTYRWGLGMGTDTLTDSGGRLDHVDLLAGISKEQLHFARNADNLELNVAGQSDKLIIGNWFQSSDNQIEEFRLANGDKVLASEVQGLVSAMAQFAAPADALASNNGHMRTLPWTHHDLYAASV